MGQYYESAMPLKQPYKTFIHGWVITPIIKCELNITYSFPNFEDWKFASISSLSSRVWDTVKKCWMIQVYRVQTCGTWHFINKNILQFVPVPSLSTTVEYLSEDPHELLSLTYQICCVIVWVQRSHYLIEKDVCRIGYRNSGRQWYSRGWHSYTRRQGDSPRR